MRTVAFCRARPPIPAPPWDTREALAPGCKPSTSGPVPVWPHAISDSWQDLASSGESAGERPLAHARGPQQKRDHADHEDAKPEEHHARTSRAEDEDPA